MEVVLQGFIGSTGRAFQEAAKDSERWTASVSLIAGMQHTPAGTEPAMLVKSEAAAFVMCAENGSFQNFTVSLWRSGKNGYCLSTVCK